MKPEVVITNELKNEVRVEVKFVVSEGVAPSERWTAYDRNEGFTFYPDRIEITLMEGE